MDLNDFENLDSRRRMSFIQKIGDYEQWNNVGDGNFFACKWHGKKNQAITMWFWENNVKHEFPRMYPK